MVVVKQVQLGSPLSVNIVLQAVLTRVHAHISVALFSSSDWQYRVISCSGMIQ